jgi:hypothetical protein
MDMATWVPDACTLPTADQPLRVAEFDGLFAGAVRPASRSAPDSLEIVLPDGAAAAAQDLIARETACCSFFAFTVRTSGDESVLEVRVPATQVAVLDALQQRVEVVRSRGA